MSSLSTGNTVDLKIRSPSTKPAVQNQIDDITIDSDSVFIGKNIGKNNTTNADFNCIVGNNACRDLVDGDSNTVVGFNACQGLTDGNNNVAVGYNALKANTTGSSNVVIGNNANITSVLTSSCVIIGDSAGSTSANVTNVVMLGTFSGNACTTSNSVWFQPSVTSNYTASIDAGSNLCYNTTTGRVTPMPFVIKTIEQTFTFSNFTGNVTNVTCAFSRQLPANSIVLRCSAQNVTAFVGDGGSWVLRMSTTSLGNNTAVSLLCPSAVNATTGVVSTNAVGLDLGPSGVNYSVAATTIYANVIAQTGTTFTNITAGSFLGKITFLQFN